MDPSPAVGSKRDAREANLPGNRWGLCCQFAEAPIKFRTTTHRYLSGLGARERQTHLLDILRHNAEALAAAVRHCRELGIGAFRITSQLLPLATHPASGYTLEGIDRQGETRALLLAAGKIAHELDVRLSFHPDQFVVLNSEREQVVAAAVAELESQAAVAELIGADTLVLHGGSPAGGTAAALDRLARGIERLSDRARTRLALENDDRHFAPADLAPLARASGVPVVYDVHHHRCRPDGLSVEAATELAAITWGGREQWTHISSPRDGWGAPNPRAHADYIDPGDFPAEWLGRRLTIDVEAKAKELAVLALMSALTPPRDSRGGSAPRSASGSPSPRRTAARPAPRARRR
jgi:UV DNA damage endonuclease